MTPSEKIDVIIKERGLSRRQVAIKAQIPPSTFQSAMERNKNISIDMLRKVAIALNVSLSDLLWEGEGPIPDDSAILLAGPNGVSIVDPERFAKISLKRSINYEVDILTKHLDIAEKDDLLDILDYLIKATNVLSARKQAIQLAEQAALSQDEIQEKK